MMSRSNVMLSVGVIPQEPTSAFRQTRSSTEQVSQLLPFGRLYPLIWEGTLVTEGMLQVAWTTFAILVAEGHWWLSRTANCYTDEVLL